MEVTEVVATETEPEVVDERDELDTLVVDVDEDDDDDVVVVTAPQEAPLRTENWVEY